MGSPSPRPWPTARVHFEEADGDGLSRPWTGPDGGPLQIWLNPPYSAAVIGRWLARLADHGRGTALIFARTETAAWFDHVWQRATAALFVRGRLRFHRPDGTPGPHDGGAPSACVAWGPEDAERLYQAQRRGDIDGAFVPIAPAACLFVSRAALGGSHPLTWRELLRAVFEREARPLTLTQLYALLSRHPKAQANKNWRPKLRQVLNQGGFTRVGVGQYALPF